MALTVYSYISTVLLVCAYSVLIDPTMITHNCLYINGLIHLLHELTHVSYWYGMAHFSLASHLAASLSISSFLCLLPVCDGQQQIGKFKWHSPGVSETWLPNGSLALSFSTTPSLGEERY